ncbi:MAG: histidinol-phosphate transaminase, partial [Verrucomicrobia bacterium]
AGKPVRPLIRPAVRRLHAYVPGEQPKVKGLIKLNTNENPFPPSPKVLAATRAAVDGRLRLYPNPTAQTLRDKLAKLHQCRPEQIIIGNGSDELLAMAVRCFVEPREAISDFGFRISDFRRDASELDPRSLVQYFTPSYSLYPVLAEIHGAHKNPFPLNPDFTWPTHLMSSSGGKVRPDRLSALRWDFRAALTLITTPNAPSGRGYSTAQLESLCRAQKGVVILDEAYVDFADENALSLALKYPHVLVARTFSKAYSLCFQRVGYMVGHAELIAALQKIRDSYNVNGLGQIAALATFDDLPYYRSNFRKIIATRERLSSELAALGFDVFPSQTNFLLVKPPRFAAQKWLERLRARKILVRWFDQDGVRQYLRITIGTDNEAEALVREAERILNR